MRIVFFIFLFVFLSLPLIASARVELVKSGHSDAVYYIDSNNIRHVFPNKAVYESWYGDDFSRVVIVSDEFLSGLSLGRNITMRPGSLIKIPSMPAVYAVEPGGILRKIVSEDLAIKIYGPDWSRRVSDVPESFWQNYFLGKSIELPHQVPDGTLYRVPTDPLYYYKWRGSIQPFASIEAVLANGFDSNDVVVNQQTFFRRDRPIDALELKIMDPANELAGSGPDCENKNIKAAFVFVTDGDPVESEVAWLKNITQNFSEVWKAATNGLSKIEISNKILILKKDNYTFPNPNKDDSVDLRETSYSYFDEFPDSVDFLLVVNNFKSFPDRNAEYRMVTNDFEGINRIILHAGNQYGSTGKLKGIANMGNINDYVFDGEFSYGGFYNLLLHEIGHHWLTSVRFRDNEGNLRTDLLRKDDFEHWSDYVNFISPVGSYGWEHKSGDEYFNRAAKLVGNLKGFSPLDLYLIGLYPPSAVGEIQYLVPYEIDKLNNTIMAEKKVVDIQQIIDAHGTWKCSIN